MATTGVARSFNKRGKIPDNFISNWQSSRGSARPFGRRPMTACNSCRAAKVKCDNDQPECRRCVNRGMACMYNNINSKSFNRSTKNSTQQQQKRRNQSSQHDHASTFNVNINNSSGVSNAADTIMATATATATFPPHRQDVFLPSMLPKDVDVDLNHSPLHDLYASDFLDMSANENLLEWSHELDHQLGNTSAEMENTRVDFINGSVSSDPSLLPPLNDSLLIRTQPNSGQSSILSSVDAGCQCRQILMTQVPRVKTVMQQLSRPKLGEVFNVTQDVIQSCQNLIECQQCQLSWSDILCIMAVFQPTQSCFTYLADADTEDVIQVSVDSFGIALFDHTNLRRILVMDLLKRASDFLARLNALGVSIMKKQLPLGNLCRINLEYLNSAIGDCEAILRTVRNSIDNATDHFQPHSDRSNDVMRK